MQRATRSDSAVRLQDFLPVLAAGNDGQRSQIGSVGAPYAALPHGCHGAPCMLHDRFPHGSTGSAAQAAAALALSFHG